MNATPGVFFPTMTTSPEKRSQNRIRVRQPLNFELTAFGSGRLSNTLEQGRGVDLSVGGMGMTTSFPLNAGQIVRLVTPTAGAEPSLPVLTEVMWSRFDNGEFRVGLRFLL